MVYRKGQKRLLNYTGAKGHIYIGVWETDNTHTIKIGYTKRKPTQRVKEQGYKVNGKLRNLFSCPSRNLRLDEMNMCGIKNVVLMKNKIRNTSTEWGYNLNKKTIDDIIKNIGKHYDIAESSVI